MKAAAVSGTRLAERRRSNAQWWEPWLCDGGGNVVVLRLTTKFVLYATLSLVLLKLNFSHLKSLQAARYATTDNSYVPGGRMFCSHLFVIFYLRIIPSLTFKSSA